MNLILVLLFFPETNYRRVLYKGETAQEVDKEAVQTIENTEKTASGQVDSTEVAGNPPYAGTYWRDLVNFRNRGTESRGIRGWPRQFSLPFRFVLVPQVLFATISYGVFLGG